MDINKLKSEDWIKEIQQHGTVNFIHADNMKFLRWARKEMLYKHWHVGIVDPPYGISIGSRMLGAKTMDKHNSRTYKMGDWDNVVPTIEYWSLLNYCCRDLIIWGGNYFVDTFSSSFEIIKEDGTSKFQKDISNIDPEGLVDIRFHSGVKAGRCFYVWDKKSNGMSFADGELALTTFDSSARIIKKARNLGEDDGEKRHPTHKPLYLYDYLHLEHELKGKRVLDTHGGSFSHAIAANKNGVNLTIMDIEKSYYDSGIEAYKQNTIKPRLMF